MTLVTMAHTSECGVCKVGLTDENTAEQIRRESRRPHHKQNVIMRCDPCMDRRQRAAREETAVSLLPETFDWASFDAPELPERVASPTAIAAAKTAVRVPRVAFLGPAGAGKTSLACAALRARYVETGQRFVFTPAALLAIARTRHKLGAGDPEAITSAIEADVLLIDDLGFEKPGPTSVNDVEMVIYERHLHARPTWVTTWMRAKDAKERYGDGIARRLFEGATVIDCGEMRAKERR